MDKGGKWKRFKQVHQTDEVNKRGNLKGGKYKRVYITSRSQIPI